MSDNKSIEFSDNNSNESSVETKDGNSIINEIKKLLGQTISIKKEASIVFFELLEKAKKDLKEKENKLIEIHSILMKEENRLAILIKYFSGQIEVSEILDEIKSTKDAVEKSELINKISKLNAYNDHLRSALEKGELQRGEIEEIKKSLGF